MDKKETESLTVDKELKTVKSVKDFPITKDNPFMSNLLVPKKGKTTLIANATDKALVNTLTGETDKSLMFATREEVDKEQFVKIFHSQLQSLFDLTKSTLKVFAYIAAQTEISKDKVEFDLEECKKFTSFSSNRVIYSALAELLDREIIARGNKTGNLYYINPAVFYKGDRLVLLKEYTVKKVSKIADKNQLDIFNSQKSGDTDQ